MELRQYLAVIRKWWWLLLLATAVAAGSSYLATRNQPLVYTAKTTLRVGPPPSSPQFVYQDSWSGEWLARTYAAIAQRAPIRGATMAALGLSFLPGYRVTPVTDTQLLEIEVTDENPERAALVAEELANQLILQSPTGTQTDMVERRDFLRQRLDRLEDDIAITDAEIGRLEESLEGMFSAREIAATRNQIAEAQAQLRSYEQRYADYLDSLGEDELNALTVFEPAVVPERPDASNRAFIIALAAGIGLLLAAGGAFLLEYLDDRVSTASDLEEAGGLSALGSIGRRDGTGPGSGLVTLDQAFSPHSEAYRTLRTNLLFSSVDQPLRTLLVTSPSPVDGKTTTAANLGVVMAQAGKSVVIVDADLRRPVMHKLFGLSNLTGVTSALLHEDPQIGVQLRASKLENLRVLCAGPLPPNPSELLGSQRMRELTEHLLTQADLIIFDSPPCLPVSDAAVLGSQVDGILLVVDTEHGRRGDVIQSARRLRQANGNILGAVLNRIPMRRTSYYSNYYTPGEASGMRQWGLKLRRGRKSRASSSGQAPLREE